MGRTRPCVMWMAVVVLGGITVACGKSVKQRETRSGSTTPPIGPVADQPAGVPSTSPMQPPGSQSGDSTIAPGQGSGSDSGSSGSNASTPSTPSPEVDFQMVKTFVTEGGPTTGYLPDGRVYFAGNETLFFALSYQIMGNVTQAIAELHAKAAADLKQAEYTGAFHTGACNSIGPRYQHIKGDASPGKSEFFIVLKGSGAARRGTGIAQFALSEQLVFVIELEPGKRACLNFAKVR